MGDPVSLTIAAVIAGTAGEMYEQGEATNAKEQALELQRKQQETLAAQEQIKRDDMLRRVQGEQLAQAAAEGMAPSSGTLGSLQLGSYNQFAESTQAGKSNLAMKEMAIDQQKSQLESQYWAQMFGDVTKAATGMGNIGVGAGGGGGGGGGDWGSTAGGGDLMDASFGKESPGLMAQNKKKPNIVDTYTDTDPFANWLQENGE